MSTLKAYSRLVSVAAMLLLLPMSVQAATAPHIASLTPTCGPTGGGTNVTITGDNFTDVASVTFGGTLANGIIVVSSTTITCSTPGGAAGAVDVVVTTSAGNDTKSGGFTYVADAVANAYPPVIQGNAQAVAVDVDGNRYVTGYFSGAVDLNSGVGLDPKASGGGLTPSSHASMRTALTPGHKHSAAQAMTTAAAWPFLPMGNGSMSRALSKAPTPGSGAREPLLRRVPVTLLFWL